MMELDVAIGKHKNTEKVDVNKTGLLSTSRVHSATKQSHSPRQTHTNNGLRWIALTLPRSSMMAQRSHGAHSSTEKDPEDYGKILEAFDQFDSETSVRIPSRRHSTGYAYSTKDQAKLKELARIKEQSQSRSKSSRRVGGGAAPATSSSKRRVSSRESSGNNYSSNRNSSAPMTSRRSKSNPSFPTTPSSDTSDDSPDVPDLPIDEQAEHSNVLKVRNRALIQENRRLQELVSEYERRTGTRQESLNDTANSMHGTSSKDLSQVTAEDDDGDGEESVSRLKGKIRSLKAKRRLEKLTLMQMEKTVKTQASEIESLQREFHRTVTELEKADKGRQDDKHKISTLTKQLADAENRNKHEYVDQITKLKSDLQKRDSELEVSLELLQSKVERIMQLEYDVETGKEKLLKAERRVEDIVKGSAGQREPITNSFQSIELISAEAEIKSLRRQNMMLKLVVEELQEARKRRSDSDIDIDSVFLKLPLDVQQELPFSIGMGGLSYAGTDDQSLDTDMASLDTNSVALAAPVHSEHRYPIRRPAR